MIARSFLMISLAGLLIWSCTSPTDSNDEPEPIVSSSLTIEAQPAAIPADGMSKMVILAEYRLNGEAAPDSTRIILLNTVGTLGHGEVYTQDGIAIDTLTSDTVVTLGMVFAIASGVRDSVEIAFEPVTQ
ncbi:hypothetical protein KKC97_14300 [bacterium]|nr:hypothetical protein [bacterium]MBU1638830.1 hypothetical protein [bacterium]